MTDHQFPVADRQGRAAIPPAVRKLGGEGSDALPAPSPDTRAADGWRCETNPNGAE